MTAHNVIALDVSVPQAVVPQSGDTYNMPRSVTIDGNLTCTGIDDNADQTVLTLGADESATFAGNVAIGQSTTPQAKLSLGANTADKKILLYDANNKYHYGFGLPSTNEHRAFIPHTSSHFFSWGTYSVSDGSTFYEKMRLSIANAALELKSGIDLNVENGDVIIGTSGKGIDYTAAGGSVLDQYKEGATFTASLGGAGGGTAVTTTGYYTKTGNEITATMEWSNVDLTGHSGDLQITGLPETAARRAYGSCWIYGAISSPEDYKPFISSTTISFSKNGSLTAGAVNAVSGCYMRVTITYHV